MGRIAKAEYIYILVTEHTIGGKVIRDTITYIHVIQSLSNVKVRIADLQLPFAQLCIDSCVE